MKKPEEILKKWYNPLHGIGDIAELQIVEAMKEFAIEFTKQHLNLTEDPLSTVWESKNPIKKDQKDYKLIDIEIHFFGGLQ